MRRFEVRFLKIEGLAEPIFRFKCIHFDLRHLRLIMLEIIWKY